MALAGGDGRGRRSGQTGAGQQRPGGSDLFGVDGDGAGRRQQPGTDCRRRLAKVRELVVRPVVQEVRNRNRPDLIVLPRAGELCGRQGPEPGDVGCPLRAELIYKRLGGRRPCSHRANSDWRIRADLAGSTDGMAGWL